VLEWILAALAVGGVLVAITQLGRDYLYAQLGARVLTDLRHQLYSHLQQLSLGFFSRTPTGEIMARFSTDLAAVENAMILGLPAGIMAAFGVLVSATILTVLEPRLALLAVLGVPLCAIGPHLIGSRAARESYALKARQSALATMIEEHLSAQPVVKAFGLARVLAPRFRTATERLRETSVRANFLTYLVERTPNIGVMVFNLLVIGVGASLTSLNGIAAAGGSNQAFVVDTTQDVNAQFLDALNKIRGAAVLPCAYAIPKPADSSQTINLSSINVAYTPGTGATKGTQQTLYQVADKSACAAAKGGWYYDNPTTPTHIQLCDETCGPVTADRGGNVSVLVGCQTLQAPLH